MRLLTIEPTPNPNGMKLTVDETLPPGRKETYARGDLNPCPPVFQKLLAIPGVASVFRMADFFTLMRQGSADWEAILSQARAALGEGDKGAPPERAPAAGEKWGQVSVYVQFFRRLPLLVKLSGEGRELRVALPEKFQRAAERARPSSRNMLVERKWIGMGFRYGSLEEAGEAAKADLDAGYTQERLDRLVSHAFTLSPDAEEERPKLTPAEAGAALDSPAWERRFAALEALGPRPEHLAFLNRAALDPHASIRRLAAINLGIIGSPDVFDPLCALLKDPSPAVRRTAGDALNDLADPRAAGPMARCLNDPNKLVRWRAARCLYELGGAAVLPALKQAWDDPEFEVRLQVRQAVERIEGGGAVKAPAWRQMTNPEKFPTDAFQ